METVRQVLISKGSQVLAISPNHSVYEAIKTMAEHEVGALVVLEHDTLVGIISERDYARKIILLGRRSRETLVREVMLTNPITVTPEDSIRTCMELMTDHRVRHLPVLDKERLVGLVSIGDAVKAIMTQQAFMIEQLEHYISGQV
jgi:CBS domain-containing protein